MLLNDLLHL